MSAKWYRGYQVVGRRDDHINRIRNLVKQHDLGGIIPSLHIERWQRGQWQFYLFLGFSSEQKDNVPPHVLQLLDSITIGHHVGDFEYAQIKSMVSAGIDTEHYRRTVAYHAPVVTPAEDPFNLSELETYTEQQPTNETILALNHLLYWLSATGAGGWQLFRRVCNLLTAETVGLDARHIFRRLRLLGHVEYADTNGTKWSVCPPALVQSSDSTRYFLAGQRTPNLLNALNELTTVEEQRQPTGQAPDLMQLHFNSSDEARQLIKDKGVRAITPIHWAGPASIQLANILPDLAGYQASLPSVSGFVPGNFKLEQWQGQGYVEIHTHQQTGLYQLTPREQNNRLSPQSLFFDAATGQWRDGPWYDLRYLAQQAAGVPCRVQYHPGQQRLAIPANYRWPDLYERALVLASGFLPLPSPDYDWYYFSDISPELAQRLAGKLNAVLEIVS